MKKYYQSPIFETETVTADIIAASVGEVTLDFSAGSDIWND